MCAVVHLSAPPSASAQTGTAWSYTVGSSSDWVAFKMRNTATGRDEIYSRRIDGTGATVQITDAASTARAGADEYAVSPDGQYVVYESSGVGDFVVELYGRRTNGAGPSVRLTRTGQTNQFQPILRFLPNTGHDFVWLWDGGTTQSDRLYRAPADGSAAESQISPVVASNSMDISRFNLTAGGARVVYHATIAGNGVEIYSSNPSSSNGSPLKLNPTNFDHYNHFTFKTTPDEQRIVWTGTDAVAHNPLMSRPLNGSLPSVQIGAYSPQTGRQPFEISRNSARVAYVSDVGSSFDRLYSTPLDGSATPLKLTDWDVERFAFTPDSNRLVYVADTNNDPHSWAPYSLFSRDAFGATDEKELFRGTRAIQRFASVGDRVLFFGSNPGVWSVPADGSAPASEFARFNVGTIVDFLLSPDERFLLLPVSTDADANAERLYAMPSDGSAAPWRVSHEMTSPTDSLYSFSFTPDSLTVIYQTFDSSTLASELYAAQLPEPSAVGVAGAIAAACAVRRRR